MPLTQNLTTMKHKVLHLPGAISVLALMLPGHKRASLGAIGTSRSQSRFGIHRGNLDFVDRPDPPARK